MLPGRVTGSATGRRGGPATSPPCMVSTVDSPWYEANPPWPTGAVPPVPRLPRATLAEPCGQSPMSAPAPGPDLRTPSGRMPGEPCPRARRATASSGTGSAATGGSRRRSRRCFLTPGGGSSAEALVKAQATYVLAFPLFPGGRSTPPTGCGCRPRRRAAMATATAEEVSVRLAVEGAGPLVSRYLGISARVSAPFPAERGRLSSAFHASLIRWGHDAGDSSRLVSRSRPDK